MATGKRYYWMKLKESFMTSDTIDYFMSIPDGANYVVLYQMLCLKTINTDGRLSRQIGEVIIPYDIEKIRRDCKWFSADTIRVALNLYQSVGLIYEDVDGTLVLADHNSLVGSETDWGEKKRRQRSTELPAGANSGDNVPTNVPQIVPTDNRDKRLEVRDKDIKSSDDRGKEDKNKADAFAVFAGDDAVLLAALRDFARMRRSVKRPLTEEAAKRMLAKLKNFPREDWVQILNNSVDKCWLGIFPLKDEDQASQQRTAMDDLRELHAMFEAEEASE